MNYSYNQLFQFTTDVLVKMGFSPAESAECAKVFLAAETRGFATHGVIRLGDYYKLWEAGRINTKPTVKIVHETPSTAVVDGDNTIGMIPAKFSMELAMQKAKQVGTGWVATRNSINFGIAGYYAMMALEQDMIGWAMTNASPLVAPTFSRERLLGTNPISIAIPAGEEPAFVADMATTTAANGKLEILQRKGQEAPLGWVQDKEGHPTVNAHELKSGGALLPLGGDREHGSHKGYALGAVVDIFSAILSGANYGPWVPPFPAYLPMPEEQPGKGIGHFFGAMRIDAFRPAADFRNDMDRWIRRFRSAASIGRAEKVLIPGDPEREMESSRLRTGIPLLKAVEDDLRQLGEKLGIGF